MRIATWNVNSLRVRLPCVLSWLEAEQPDLLALQEIKSSNEDFPLAAINDAGYHASVNGQKAYNGVAMLSKLEVTNVITCFPQFDDPQRRVIAANIGEIVVVNVYVPNGAEVGTDKYRYKLEWLAQLERFIESLVNQYEYVVVLGDFNVAPEDRDVYDPVAWAGKILVSPAERESFQALLRHDLVDCFRLFPQQQDSFSWWDYRAAGFERNLGLRIDHILATDSLAELCTACYVDKAPRALERPSDHAPVIAEFDI